MSPSCCRAAKDDSSPTSSTIFPSLSVKIVVPEKRISFPELGCGRFPMGKSNNGCPVCFPPPNQRATTNSFSAINGNGESSLKDISGNACPKKSASEL